MEEQTPPSNVFGIRDAFIASVEVTRRCAERLYHPPSIPSQAALEPRRESHEAQRGAINQI
jgi:hypothetical protein